MATARHTPIPQEHDDADEDDGIDWLTPEESSAYFDEQVRLALNISGEEFLRRWDAGEFRPIPDTREGWKVGRLVMLMPLVRP